MRILHVAETAKGGVGTYLNELIPLQIQSPTVTHVKALLPTAHRSQLPDVPQPLIRTFDRKTRSILSSIGLVIVLLKEVARFRPHIVHAHSSVAGVVTRLIYGAPWTSTKVIYCPHGWGFGIEWPLTIRLGVAAIEKFLSYFCAGIVTISLHDQAIAERAGISPRKLYHVLNGISDLAGEPAAWESKGIKLLFVGRLDRQKGVDLLISAAAEFEHTVSIRVLGSSVVDPQFAFCIPHNVEMLGWCGRAEVDAQMRAADAVVVPSRWEGFGLVAVEAMRAGRPVLASRVGGLSEIVEDGVTGFLFEAGSVQSLTAGIYRLISADRDSLGRAGRARFLQLFSIKRAHEQILELYMKACWSPAGFAPPYIDKNN